MGLETLPWDVVDHLTDDAAIAAYLDAALEDGDPKLVGAALGDIARAKKISDLPVRTGLSRDELDRTLSGETSPDLWTVMKVVDALGLRLGAAHKTVEDAA